jgi:hypothetical protein
MINTKQLIHPVEEFLRENIEKKKLQFNFPQTSKVELFLWDLELFAQLQRRLGDKVVLKGGAAAQLHLLPEKQRTSVNIDVIFLEDPGTVESIMKDVSDSLSGDFIFEYNQHKPKQPKTDLPMVTYFIQVPSLTMSEGILTATDRQALKIDFHLSESLGVKT